jgi:hypothetical protein
MISPRSTLIAAVLAVAVGLTTSLLSAGAPATPPAAPATAATKVGSVSGKVVGKDGKPAVGANVRFAAATTAPATTPGGRGARGARGGRGPTTPTDDKGAFKLTDVPVGLVNITANLTADDGTRQTGTTATPVEVKEGAETKLTAEIKLADAPARGARGAGGPPAGN